MSAINIFAFQNAIVFPRTCCACEWTFPEEIMPVQHEPVVTARWSLETAADGTCRLVRHWFTADQPTAGAGNHRQG